MSAEGSNNRAGGSAENSGSLVPDDDRSAASTYSPSDRVGDEEARRNALRLSLAERWRRALGDIGEPTDPASTASLRPAVAEGSDEVWEAREMSGIWAQAEHDEALLAMLREEDRGAMGSEEVDQAVFDIAQARFLSRLREAASQAPQVLAEPTRAQRPGLTVGEVIEAMEREPQGIGSRRLASWSSILGPMSASREALPSHITAQAMRAFWEKRGISIPREVSTAFNQAARLLLMGRASSGARLSLARESRPSGISHAVARLALESAHTEADAEPEAEPGDEESRQESSGEES